ncbi:MFS transporter [Deminuibacter soli]|uniref:MFS transporter n=1 Tax=Deminuibacter soli TaxID=2291815 RepID=A0A3E1NGS6_9BACT|nr:MFS transporter [Deminuibacter soli]RFM27155.1 MFS transporter [Deminuibacter soli]
MKTTTIAPAPDFTRNAPAAIATPGITALFLCCFFSSTLGGTVSTLMSVYLPVAVKDLLSSNHNGQQLENIGASINAVFIYGWMAGGFIWGLLCDRIGRKQSFLYATLCYGLFTVLTGFSYSWISVVVFRFLTGFGVGGVLVTTTILVSEAYSDKKRAVALGILSISIPLGIFSAGLINYFIASWRFGFAIGLLPVVIALLGARLIKSGVDGPLTTQRSHTTQPSLFSPNTRKNLVGGSLIFGAALIGLWATFSWLPSWIQSLLGTADAQKERGMSMMLMGAGGLTGGFISGWIVNALGVRKTMMVCFAGCFLLSFTLFKLTTAVSPLLYLQIAAMALFFGISQGALSVYIPQLFPKNISASATGFCFNIGRLFTATVVFFIGSLVTFLGGYGNAVFSFSFVFLLGLIVTLFFRTEKYSG